ncbi:MAG: hypothetical protein JXR96_30655, partial [Deltaproteobacteria bacterium]|nr:hypothetical protein [Deltaproteobacteria bacterium]
MRWLILISAAASLLTQAGLWWVVLRGRPRGAPTPGARALSAAVLLGPLLIAALLVIAVHLGRLGVFELMIAPASVKQAYLAGTCEGLCAVGSPRVFAGVALLAMGGLSLIAAAIAWQRRRIADLGELSFAACLGIGLLSGVLGLSALLLDLRLARIQALYDQEESDLLLAALKDFSHPWWIEAAIGLVLLMAFTVLVSRICKLDPGRRPGGHALVGSIAVLALGVAAFCVTRLHARDLDRGIDVMAGAKGPDGRLRVPAALRSAVYGGLRAREQLDVENEVKLPLSGSEGFVVRDPCVRISGSLEAVKLEGVQVAALGKGLLDEQAHG